MLTSLNLRMCNLSDAGLAFLAMASPSLQTLNLGWCQQLTDVGIASLSIGVPKLKRLDLTYCHKITDRSLTTLSSFLELERLSLVSFALLYCISLRWLAFLRNYLHAICNLGGL